MQNKVPAFTPNLNRGVVIRFPAPPRARWDPGELSVRNGCGNADDSVGAATNGVLQRWFDVVAEHSVMPRDEPVFEDVDWFQRDATLVCVEVETHEAAEAGEHS